VPEPLPPRLEWSAGLAGALSAADRAIGRLAGEGRRLPNPHLLIRPFVRREAVLSCRIEGTQATLGELLASEAGAAVGRSPADLHETATLGEFRRSQNWIGPAGCTLGDAAYVPPPPDELTGCLGEWEKFLHDDSLPPLIHAALAHSQFEAIHPFLDGDGRVGRLLITLLLIEKGVLPAPPLCLSAFFEATRQEYYARLMAVTEKGEWEEWLGYRGPSRLPERTLDLFVENPFWTVNRLAERLGVAFTTAQRALDRLESARMVTLAREAKRNRVYCARAVLEILDEPARLATGRTARTGRAV
jgi:Fic family protein